MGSAVAQRRSDRNPDSREQASGRLTSPGSASRQPQMARRLSPHLRAPRQRPARGLRRPCCVAGAGARVFCAPASRSCGPALRVTCASAACVIKGLSLLHARAARQGRDRCGSPPSEPAQPARHAGARPRRGRSWAAPLSGAGSPNKSCRNPQRPRGAVPADLSVRVRREHTGTALRTVPAGASRDLTRHCVTATRSQEQDRGTGGAAVAGSRCPARSPQPALLARAGVFLWMET